MGLKVVPAFGKDVFASAMSIAIERAKRRAINLFIEAGRSFNDYTKANKGFENQTFSLISSIGFIVVSDGDLVHEEFIEGGNSLGKSKGLNVAKANKEDQGVMLICVAGEDYAMYVESKGKDVITGSAQFATSWLRNILNK